MQFGTTFSHRHSQELGLAPEEALGKAIELGFDVIRLCLYWDEVQPTKSRLELSQIQVLLKLCQTKRQAVILTLGMKAPRWPEFYVPAWAEGLEQQGTEKYLLGFLKKAVIELAKFRCIKYWQIENEPLDPSGKHGQVVPLELLEREVELVRSLDKRPVVLTAWGNELTKRRLLPILAGQADIVGIDLYFRQYSSLIGIRKYVGPRDSDLELESLLKKSRKPIWVTELQAEPWEKDEAGYRAPNPLSCSPSLLKTFLHRAEKLPVEAILLWGVEYWLWKARQGDDCYLELWREFKKTKN